MTKPSHDWAALEQAFIHSDKKLIEFSKERTGFESSPIYSSLRKRAGQHNWSDKRAEAKAIANLVPIEPEKREAIASLNSQVEKLVDAASVISDHLKLSRSLKGFYAALGTKIQVAIAALDATELTADNIIRALSVMNALINGATDLERRTLGLAEPLQQVELTTRYVISMGAQGEVIEGDLPALTRDEWHRKYGNGDGNGQN